MVLFLNILMLVFCHLSVYFLTRRNENKSNVNKFHHKLLQERSENYQDNHYVMALLVQLFPPFLSVLFWSVSSKSSISVYFERNSFVSSSFHMDVIAQFSLQADHIQL